MRSAYLQIQCNYSQVDAICQIQCDQPDKVCQLSVTHSKLKSLKGIQRYMNLQKLNVKYNDLTRVQQLNLIQQPAKITQLNIQGNQIEYYSQCMYVSLKERFINLKYLNNRDYSAWKDKKSKKNKKTNMKSICSKADNLSKQMKETLKKTIKANIREQFRNRINYQEQSQQSNTYRTVERSPSIRQQHKISCQDYLEEQRSQPREITLQHANFVKSTHHYDEKCYSSAKSEISQQNYNKTKKQNMPFIINTIQFDNNQLPCVLQPTATFASQRQKQNVPFRSRNAQKSIINLVLEEHPHQNDYENFESYGDDQSFVSDYSDYSQQNNAQYQGYSRVRKNAGNFAQSMIFDQARSKEAKKLIVAQVFNMQYLARKVFDSLKPLNMPLIRNGF